MFLSKSCLYAIRATIYVATVEDKQFMSIRHISETLDISFHFLTKILQTLTQDGIMTSYRGPNGGIMLARKADSIMLIDLVRSIDGENIFTECFLGLPKCGNTTPCPVHDYWASIRADIAKVLSITSIANLAANVNILGHRLSDKELLDNVVKIDSANLKDSTSKAE